MRKGCSFRKKKVLRRTKPEETIVKRDDPLFEHLRAVRKELAEKRVPPFVVFSDKTLKDMCEKKPTDEQMFLEVSGVGQNKLERYGAIFLDAINEFSTL